MITAISILELIHLGFHSHYLKFLICTIFYLVNILFLKFSYSDSKMLFQKQICDVSANSPSSRYYYKNIYRDYDLAHDSKRKISIDQFVLLINFQD